MLILKLGISALNHLNIDKLRRIQRDNLVHGFAVKRGGGGGDRVCHCDMCSMAKLRRPPTPPQHSPYSLPLKYIGQRVSCDTKEVPFKSLRGYRYVLVFVDHYSRLEFCNLMRSKGETTEALERYISEMKHLAPSTQGDPSSKTTKALSFKVDVDDTDLLDAVHDRLISGQVNKAARKKLSNALVGV